MYTSMHLHLPGDSPSSILVNSTSNVRVDLGGITPLTPSSP